MFTELFLIWQKRERSPRLRVPVFMKDSDAAFLEHAYEFFDQQRRIADKRDDPSAPGKVVILFRQIVGHQIQFVNLYVRKRASATRFFCRTHELTRTFDRDYYTRRPDNLRKIDSGITRPGADIEHAAAHGDTGFLPAIEDHGAPDSMLQTKSRQLLIVRAENIIAFPIHNLSRTCFQPSAHLKETISEIKTQRITAGECRLAGY